MGHVNAIHAASIGHALMAPDRAAKLGSLPLHRIRAALQPWVPQGMRWTPRRSQAGLPRLISYEGKRTSFLEVHQQRDLLELQLMIVG